MLLRRWIPVVVGGAVCGVCLWTLAPRLGSTFPSMIDDWYAISRSPDQVGDALLLRLTEEQRYRPGWVVWNALQWHTLGGPDDLRPALGWGIARALVLVLGLFAAAAVVASRAAARRLGSLTHAVLAGGVTLAVVTIPGFAVDLARYGPQEPLMVGLMCLGGALATLAVRLALDGRSAALGVAVVGGGGAALWAAGVAQKETSICALALVPFLWPALRSELARVRDLSRTVRGALLAVGGVMALAFVPMVVRTIQLTLRDDRVYDAEPTGGLGSNLLHQLERAGDELGSPGGAILAVAAVALVVAAAIVRRVDWVAVGLLVTGVAFLVFAGQTEVTVSRYYLPSLALAALAIARAGPSLPTTPVRVVAVGLVALGLWQAPEARRLVDEWVTRESEKEAVVRAVAQREAGGCAVRATGNETELVSALPVLVPHAEEAPAGCASGDRFVVVLSSSGSDDSGDPLVLACRPGEVVFENPVGRILRCGTP